MPEEKTLLEATVCFLVRGDEILLAKKTKKIGAGCWNGYGGGLEPGEDTESAATRELFEESAVSAFPSDLEKAAVIDFHNTKSDGSTFVCRVHFFIVSRWTGVPRETGEMAEPTWFKRSDPPLSEMMPADKIFVPLVLAGKKIVGIVHYGPFQKVLLQEPMFTEVSSFTA